MDKEITKNLLQGKICKKCLYHELEFNGEACCIVDCGGILGVKGKDLPKELTCIDWSGTRIWPVFRRPKK